MGRSGQRVQKGGLGKALARTQKKTSATRTSDVKSSAGKYVSARDGGDATVALASFLEGSSLDDFLATAVLANREFAATKESMLIVNQAPTLVETQRRNAVVPEMTSIDLKVPRRPGWTETTTGAELNLKEKEAFLDWRRDIAELEASHETLEVTPFEKNLEVWRQLWHVRERSDVIVQILDARNPLFYRSKDLEAYAREGQVSRRTLLIMNKSDFLNKDQRKAWGQYFASHNGEVQVVFFSAKEAQDEIDAKVKGVLEDESTSSDDKKPSEHFDEDDEYPVLSRESLYEFLTGIADEVLQEVGTREKDKGLIKFGMVGFPNVGKSSVINALLGASTYSHKTQRVAVGATPGKTKHFQTLILSDKIMLCDCPGLVFPSFVNSKAEMYCCGVLSLSQLRDHVGPCYLVTHRVPKRFLECQYGITIPINKTAKETDPVDVYAMLESYARYRGYTTTGKGGPDTSHAARDILRDYVNGKLLYCHPPPDCTDSPAFDIHRVAAARFPKILATPSAVEKASAEEGAEEETTVAEEEVELDFDTTGEDKRIVSKRLAKHGRKGRKARDKTPYEESDVPGGVTTVHINKGGKKRTTPHERRASRQDEAY